jgi:hypothetical protein
MIARVMKKSIEESDREAMKNLKFSTQEPFLRIIIRSFDELFHSWDEFKARIESKYNLFLNEQPSTETKANAVKVKQTTKQKTKKSKNPKVV